jgi:hypothetical protein
MVEALYGLTRDDEKQYEKMLSTVRTLPCIVTLDKFRHAMVVDGVADDVFEQSLTDSEKSEEKLNSYTLPPNESLITKTKAHLMSIFNTKAPINHRDCQYTVLGTSDEAMHAAVGSTWDFGSLV